jgi:UDP-2,4-diacetamido-2,4,6-trideoxy-beta-L-altropyranose hydrolase
VLDVSDLASSELVLRKADLADARFLLALRNDAVTRRFSFDHHEITEAEHLAWLTVRLSDPSSLIWIALNDNHPVGQLRLTRLTKETAEVHIIVAPDFRGRGFAHAMLLRAAYLCVRSWPEVVGIRARTLPENEASLRAFRAAGFHDVGHPGERDEKVLQRKIGMTHDRRE